MASKKLLFAPLLPYLFFFSFVSFSSALPDRYTEPSSPTGAVSQKEYFEVATPPAGDSLYPSCSLHLPQQDFGNTNGAPPAAVFYSPPANCPARWSSVVLEFRASCQGVQRDRIAGVWLDGVEILRTSTAQPTESGVFWKLRKDVTKYSSLLARSNLSLTVMLENTINDVLTGVYHVNVSLYYYQGFIYDEPRLRVKGSTKVKTDFFYTEPADLIIPISSNGDGSYWFKIHNESNGHTTQVQIPTNTYKAVLEIYVSAHEDDEFWYANPPTFYIKTNNLTSKRVNGAFRQVFVTVDDLFVGSASPFPVIYTGGVNPLFWDPAVAIGAFDLPTHDLELTPFLGFLLDGKHHYFRLGVTDAIPFWLVGGNLHLWLDYSSTPVQAGTLLYSVPGLCVQRDSQFKNLDGVFKISASRRLEYSGWVRSSVGNFTTYVSYEFQSTNLIEFQKNGRAQDVEQEIKTITDVRVESLLRQDLRVQANIVKEYPIHLKTTSESGFGMDRYWSTAEVAHGYEEKVAVALARDSYQTTVFNTQDSRGFMNMVGRDEDGDGGDRFLVNGSAKTRQSLRFRDRNRCYSQTFAASNGEIVRNIVKTICATSSS